MHLRNYEILFSKGPKTIPHLLGTNVNCVMSLRVNHILQSHARCLACLIM